MSRPKKKEIKFTKDSILSVLQEIYNEIVEQRNTAIRIQNKMLSLMKDSEDMQTIGPIIKEQQKIINDCVEKKLSLSKLLSNIWEKNSAEENDFTLDDLDQDLVQSIIEKDIQNSDHTYKINK